MRNEIRTPSASEPIARLNVESLEPRDTPAGNVTAFWVGADLYVLGDGNPAGNQVEVAQDGAGNLFVTGLEGTTVNGQAQVYAGTGVPNRVSIQLNGSGPDFARAFNLTTSVLDVTTGTGDDAIVLNGVAANSIWADAGAGNDIAYVRNVSTWNGAYVSGGDGSDTLYLGPVSGPTNFQQFEFAHPLFG